MAVLYCIIFNQGFFLDVTRNQAAKSSIIEHMRESESIISTKSLNLAETKELRGRTMGSVNIHRDICNSEHQPKCNQTNTDLTSQSSLSRIIDVSNKPDVTSLKLSNVPCQGVQDINNPGYRNTKNLCFNQECSQPFVNKKPRSEQVDNSTNDVTSNVTNTDATKVRSKVSSFLSASEPNVLLAENAGKPVGNTVTGILNFCHYFFMLFTFQIKAK